MAARVPAQLARDVARDAEREARRWNARLKAEGLAVVRPGQVITPAERPKPAAKHRNRGKGRR